MAFDGVMRCMSAWCTVLRAASARCWRYPRGSLTLGNVDYGSRSHRAFKSFSAFNAKS